MELIYQNIIGIALMANVVVISGVPSNFIRRYFKVFHSRELQSVKPFTCALCMGFWLMLLYQAHTNTIDIDAVLISFITAFISETINRLFNNIPI